LVGSNGSGKSAVLVAIAIALGSRATYTNRASSLSGLIQNGKNSATVRLQLRNQGKESWKHDEYGDSIVIERKINKSGSSYKFMSLDGTVVAKNTKELAGILEQFNIQINNPCCILMQDTSREFLFKNSPSSKYMLFLIATQLEAIRVDLKSIDENIAQIKENLEKKNQL